MLNRLTSMMFNPVSRYREISAKGVLGMNQRNHNYIARYNSRKNYPVVDNKLLTKQLALEFGLTTPDLVGVIESQHDVQNVPNILVGHSGFCIKPSKGSGGKGILVIKDAKDGLYQRSNGEWMAQSDVKRHVSNILAGLFSLGGATDVAMLDTLLVPSKAFDRFSSQGVPDLRVIVFRGIPVMAMIRLACASSNGKANLHQGAIGVGLDISSRGAINAVQKDQCIDVHPDTGVQFPELGVPQRDA